MLRNGAHYAYFCNRVEQLLCSPGGRQFLPDLAVALTAQYGTDYTDPVQNTLRDHAVDVQQMKKVRFVFVVSFSKCFHARNAICTAMYAWPYTQAEEPADSALTYFTLLAAVGIKRC